MITGWSISGSDEASAIVCTPEPGMLNWIRFVVFGGGGLALESRIACRSEPAPLSLVLVTVKVIMGWPATIISKEAFLVLVDAALANKSAETEISATDSMS